MVTCDVIVPANSHNPVGWHHSILVANAFAQTEALMTGQTAEEARAELAKQGLSTSIIEGLLPHRCFAGNRPSNTILMDRVSPRTLGMLLALYEHKVFVQGVIWNINSFDQWGVELGKQLAGDILCELAGDEVVEKHDSSTNSLINAFKTLREPR